MGRLTWESMGRRALPGRRNIVLTKGAGGVVEGIETYADLAAALNALEASEPTRDVWFIGGARVYAAAMDAADVIDLTYVPERIAEPRAVRFPPIDPGTWVAGERVAHEDEPALSRRVFTRRTPR